MMKVFKNNSIWLLLSVMALLTACSKDDRMSYSEDLEIRRIEPYISAGISTRAAAPAAVEVGRTEFEADDRIVFTTIKRTAAPLTEFTYSNIRYYFYEALSWERVDGDLPEKIYWTDGASPHTFIGYSLPTAAYHWTDNGDGTFAGELGYGQTELDYTPGNSAMKQEDLLLNYDTETVAETGGLSTKVTMYHAMSNVCVIVNIKDFAASTSAVDTRVRVSNLVLHDQPAKYTWGGDSRNLKVLNLSNAQQVTKDIRLWCKNEAGEGNAQSKTFTFYGITTPQDELFHAINGNDAPLAFSFTVTYPDPLNPDGDPLVKTYSGAFSQTVNLHSGMATTLNISLNHKDEQMFMGVEYNDWNFVSTPNLGELRKKSTFMDISSPVTTQDMPTATADDATWLYRDGDVIKDIYGNDGSELYPYRISSALQLLSFAKEVTGGMTFQGKYIRQDADITMQSASTKTILEDSESGVSPVSWIGIGDATHPFEGTYLADNRYVNRLYGKPLFAKLGERAVVRQLQITTIGTISGGGALTDVNEGIIGGCRIADDVTTSAGAIAGTNSGVIYACCHTGITHGTGGLVGTNTGTVVGCYQAGEVDGGTDYSIAATNSGVIDCPEATSQFAMQQESFCQSLNETLQSWYDAHSDYAQFTYVHYTASYPSVH